MRAEDIRRLGAAFLAAVALATALIMRWEGDGNRVGYRDIVGVVTACYGHTGPEAVVGRRYTPAECNSLLALDVAIKASAVHACIRNSENMDPRVLASFISLTYNIGDAAFCHSTVARRANLGDTAGACDHITDWRFAGHQDCRIRSNNCYGLYARRLDEQRLCRSGLTNMATTAP